MTDADLITAYLAKRKPTRCATQVPKHLIGRARTPHLNQEQLEREPAGTALLGRLQGRFDALLRETPDAPQRDAEWWSRYVIGCADPWRDIAEAGALLVIARDEGVASYRLFQKELCRKTSAD